MTFGEPKIDLDKLRAFKDRSSQKLTGGVGQVGEAAQGQVHPGHARRSPSPTSLTIDLVDRRQATQTLTFEHAIIATGSRPATVPGLSIDSPRVMDSTGALDLPDIPKTLLVVGGGYIGLELGSVYAALGTKVTVVEMTPGLLPGADRDLVAVLAQAARADARTRCCSTRGSTEMKDVKSGVEGQDRRRRACGRGQGADVRSRARRRSAAGRTRAMPGLDKTKVKVDERGFIDVDAARRTAEPTHLRDRRRRRRADARAQGVARGARRGRSDRRAQRRRSSRRRFPPSSSPIPKSPGAA